MKIGQKIRRRREELRLSQADLGRQVGVSQATIDKIEAGHTARSRYLPMIAVKLGLPLEELDPGLVALSAAGALTGPVLPMAELTGGERDFPIHASAEGGQGQIILSPDAVDFMPRPAPLAHVKGAYGLYIRRRDLYLLRRARGRRPRHHQAADPPDRRRVARQAVESARGHEAAVHPAQGRMGRMPSRIGQVFAPLGWGIPRL